MRAGCPSGSGLGHIPPGGPAAHPVPGRGGFRPAAWLTSRVLIGKDPPRRIGLPAGSGSGHIPPGGSAAHPAPGRGGFRPAGRIPTQARPAPDDPAGQPHQGPGHEEIGGIARVWDLYYYASAKMGFRETP